MPEELITDAQPADSSPAPAFTVPASVKSDDFATFRAESLARESGKPAPPSVSPDGKIPASSAGEPDVQAASTDATHKPAASEPAKPSPANAETRVKELLAERHSLRTELEQLRAQLQPRQPAQPETKPAASSPAPVSEGDFPEYGEWLAQEGNAEKSYETYIRAMVKHEHAQEVKALKDAEAAEVRVREHQTKQAAFREQVEQFEAEHPDFRETVGPVLAIPLNTPTAHALVDALQTSGPKLLYALAKDTAVLDRLLRLPERLALYELGKFEAALPTTVSPTPKVVTSAPAPPTTLGRKPVETGSDTQRAVRAGDFSSFRESRLREEAAQRSGQR